MGPRIMTRRVGLREVRGLLAFSALVILLLGSCWAVLSCGGQTTTTSTTSVHSTATTLPTNTQASVGVSTYYDLARITLEGVYADSQDVFSVTMPEEMAAAVEQFKTSIQEALAKWRTVSIPPMFEGSHALGLATLEAYDEGLAILHNATFASDASGLEQAQALMTQGDAYYRQWRAKLAEETTVAIDIPADMPGELVPLLQAVIDAYNADVGELGETMTAAENAAIKLFTGEEMPAPTPENIAEASKIADQAIGAWEAWKNRSAPIEEVATLHDEMLKYLEIMSAALSHLKTAVQFSDPSEYLLYVELGKEAYIHKKAAAAEVTRLSGL